MAYSKQSREEAEQFRSDVANFANAVLPLSPGTETLETVAAYNLVPSSYPVNFDRCLPNPLDIGRDYFGFEGRVCSTPSLVTSVIKVHQNSRDGEWSLEYDSENQSAELKLASSETPQDLKPEKAMELYQECALYLLGIKSRSNYPETFIQDIRQQGQGSNILSGELQWTEAITAQLSPPDIEGHELRLTADALTEYIRRDPIRKTAAVSLSITTPICDESNGKRLRRIIEAQYDDLYRRSLGKISVNDFWLDPEWVQSGNENYVLPNAMWRAGSILPAASLRAARQALEAVVPPTYAGIKKLINNTNSI